jgi:hypothetical protein
MAGLVAVVSRDPSRVPVTSAHLADLTRAYEAVRGASTQETAEAGAAAHVAVMGGSGGRAQLERDDASWAAFVGRPYPDGSLIGRRLEDLDGQFGLIVHDAKKDEIRVVSDPFGMQTLYIADRGPLTYVSTSVLVLAKCLGASPNRFALEIFLRAGYHFGSLTSWEGIERLEPATCLTFGSNGASRSVYWRPERDHDVTRLPFSGAVAHCSEVGLEMCREYFSGRDPVWLDLTGGFDTRLLALLLEAGGVDFICDTRGDFEDDDRRLAREIAALKGWELFDPVLPDNWAELLPSVLESALVWGDGNLQVFELAWVLWVHSRLADVRAELLSAGGGEHWRGFAWPQEFLRAGRSTRVNMDNWIDMRLLHPLDMSVFKRDPTPDVREDFRRRMLDWVAPYKDELNTFQLDMMYAYKMTGHFGAYRSSDYAYMTAELPFYIKPVFTAAVSVDHRHRSSHRLMRHAIWRLDRTVAAIPTASGGPAMPLHPTRLHRFLPYYARIGRRAVTKLAQTTIGRPLLASNMNSWWEPPAARRAVLELLGNGAVRRREMRSLSLYDPRALEKLLETARAETPLDAQLLGRIITVELSLRLVDAAVDT